MIAAFSALRSAPTNDPGAAARERPRGARSSPTPGSVWWWAGRSPPLRRAHRCRRSARGRRGQRARARAGDGGAPARASGAGSRGTPDDPPGRGLLRNAVNPSSMSSGPATHDAGSIGRLSFRPARGHDAGCAPPPLRLTGAVRRWKLASLSPRLSEDDGHAAVGPCHYAPSRANPGLGRDPDLQRGGERRTDRARRGARAASDWSRAGTTSWWSTTTRPTAPDRSPTGSPSEFAEVEVLHRAREDRTRATRTWRASHERLRAAPSW